MDISYFYKGLIIGVSIAAPVGPIGILCIRRTLSSGRIVGFLSGLGAATADAFYGGIAAFGLTFISNLLIQQQIWLRLVGGAFLLYLGIKTMLSQPTDPSPQMNQISLIGAYGSTFILTLTNPLTILSFAAIFTGFGLADTSGGYATAALTILGVFLGSASWWLILSGITGLLRNRVSNSFLRWVNRISGFIIFGFGIFAIIGISYRHL